MKITRIRPLVMGTPWRNLTFLVVETDEGLTGVGEVRMINNTDALLGYISEAAPRHVLGQDPFNRELIVDTMRRNDYSRAGEVAMSGIALIEMACWDIMGKALNQPVYRLMGGAVRQKIKAYANGWYTVERTPEEFAKAAKAVVARTGRKYMVYYSERIHNESAMFATDLVQSGAIGRVIHITTLAPHRLSKASRRRCASWDLQMFGWSIC